MFSVAADLSTVPGFGLVGWTIVLVVVGHLTLLAPLQGRRAFLKLRLARPTDPGALLAFYRANMIKKAVWLLPTALLLLIVPGLRGVHLGLAWPHGPSTGEATGSTLNLVVIILLSGLMYRRMARRGEQVPRPRRLDIVLPGTRAERLWACAVSVSAGVCEEVLFRGLLITAGIAAGWPPVVAVLASSALFGLVHLYQGWLGMVFATAFGLFVAWIYLRTGSLLLPITLHVVMDLRALVMVPAVAPPAEPTREALTAPDPAPDVPA